MTIAAGITLPEAELAEICRRYQIKELSLFGSTVRGEARPDSDIDLLVEFLPEAKIGLFERFDAELELSNLFGKKVDLVSKKALRERFRREILAEARSIYAA
jgi:predicted nucleotidyltransferase